MTLSVEDLIATAHARTDKVSVCARGDLVERHGELVAELNATIAESNATKSLGGNAELPEKVAELHDAIVKLEAEQDEYTTTFEVRSIGPLAWANLLRSHPPRKGRDDRLSFNLATFPPAAVAACVVEPPMTVDQAAKLYGTDAEPGVLSSAEWDKLFAAAYVLNEGETPHPKLPAAIGALLQSVRSSTTAANAESLAPSSSADNGAP